jgi:hypothetical protein
MPAKLNCPQKSSLRYSICFNNQTDETEGIEMDGLEMEGLEGERYKMEGLKREDVNRNV